MADNNTGDDIDDLLEAFDIEDCPRSVNVDSVAFFRFVCIPAVLLIVALQLLRFWETRHEHGFCTMFSTIWPVNIIGQRRHRFPYVAAFNVTTWSLFEMILGESPLKLETTIAPIRTLLKITTLLVLAIIFYPLFACISSENLIGYALGGVYVWMLTIVYIISNYPNDCGNGVPSKSAYDTFQFLPCLFWMLFLCIYFPLRIILRLRAGRKVEKPILANRIPFWREYVRRLVNLPGECPVPYMASYGAKGSLLEKITKYIFKKFYTPVVGYRYPVSMLTATTVSLTLVWSAAIEILQLYHILSLKGKEFVLDAFGPQVKELLVNNTMVKQAIKESPSFEAAMVWWRSMSYALFISFALSYLSTMISLFFTLNNYRYNIFQYYKGVVIDVPRVAADKAPRAVVVSGSKYVGYQFAYALWGFAIKALILLVVCAFLIAGVVLITYFKNIQLLWKILLWLGPLFGYMYGIMIIQQLLVHWFFLQKDEHGKRVLAINRVFPFFNFQYFMIFLNSAVGLFSCLLRIIKSALFGAFTLSRLDISIMSRTFEKKDKGFIAYVCMLELENVQTNPIVLTFIDLLQEVAASRRAEAEAQQRHEINGRRASGESDAKTTEQRRRRNVVMHRWQVAMTLVNSTYLRHFRKQEIQAVAGEDGFAAAGERAKFDMMLLLKQKAASAFSKLPIKLKSRPETA